MTPHDRNLQGDVYEDIGLVVNRDGAPLSTSTEPVYIPFIRLDPTQPNPTQAKPS